ncbi:MAG: hypothetical protein MR601_03860 [Erysipelotrichaceae bacterium]|nr:hypothetical protein [Erysipelotrichaceae bacterium]
MKSKVIKQRNIPQYPIVLKTVRVKPMFLIFLLIVVGVFIVFFNDSISMIGVLMVVTGLFCLLILPDVKIIEYTDEYAIVYNCREKDDCKLIYWDDILSWQYKWKTDRDELVIELVDHSIETVYSFKKSTIVPYFKKYALNKEKNRRGK